LDLHKVTLGAGKTWSITLPGLGSAGYVWKYQIDGRDDIVSVSHESTGGPPLPPAGAEPPPGYSRDEVFTIVGLRPGRVKVRLVQSRTWEAGKPPFREVILEIEVVGRGERQMPIERAAR
jgi:hypothetical protein